MNYIKLETQFRNFTVFSFDDIKKIDPNFQRRRLTEWQDKGYITKVIKGFYVFAGLKLNENAIFEIANRIYAPSYISFEMALSYYGLIPESVYGITSASTKRTRMFKAKMGEFTYRTLKPSLFFGYDIVSYGDKHFKIASPEKAVLDYFYINPKKAGRDDYASLRFNKEQFFKVISERKLKVFLKGFGQRTLARNIKSFLEYMKNA